MPTTPTCHRTLTHAASPCIGSACALWVPEVRPDNPKHYPFLRCDGATDITPTGRGVCADNLRAAPFDDPAATPGVKEGA